MKLYKIYYDTTIAVVLADNEEEVKSILMEDNSNFSIKDDKLVYNWTSSIFSYVYIEEYILNKGVIFTRDY